MEFPYVLRLVEFSGEGGVVRLRLPGEVASACCANLLGEPIESLQVQEAPPAEGISPWSQIELSLRPYEIATLYLDIVQGRKLPRNLDAYRHVWATVHRVEKG
ncbi:MAG: glycosyl hydrolase-related protein [Fimbriimonadales bacterium]|nr:glycosyl hydrolase-related protein [Fimbriimonadales bacterium]